MMKRESGFTITELMTVAAIIGVMAALAVPNLVGQMPRYRLNGAGRQMMGDLMWARMEAVSQKNKFTMSLLNDHEYVILDDDDNDGTADPGEWTVVKDMRTRYPDVTLSVTANPTFFPRGSASPCTVTLGNDSGSKKIKVHITGRVKIEE